MKETVLDVLMFLFENYIEDADIEPDRNVLQNHLLDAGFQDGDIDRAFDWLEGLSPEFQPELHAELTQRPQKTIRIFSDEECERINVETRGFLLYLEQHEILNTYTREVVIDRIMALDAEDVDLDEVKWVILMVLFNQPGEETAFTWLEDAIFDEPTSLFLH